MKAETVLAIGYALGYALTTQTHSELQINSNKKSKFQHLKTIFFNLTFLFGAINKFKLRNTSVRDIIYFLGFNICFCDNNHGWYVDLWLSRWWQYLCATNPSIITLRFTFLFCATNTLKLHTHTHLLIASHIFYTFIFASATNDRNRSVVL